MKDYKYIFGPVPSRRMGLSIGISPIPKKSCNYSCIYCQLGRTKHLTNKRENYFDYHNIVNEFKAYLINDIKFDVVTIVGEGEPSLYLSLGKLIKELKALTQKPVAVITNGALMYDSNVREELKNADIVLPSLDAYNESIFKKINRPYGKIKFDQMIEGLRIFSQEYAGQLWIETMIINDINASKDDFLGFKALIDTMNYDRLYINTPVRPPAENWVKSPSKEAIDLAVSILGGISIDKLVSAEFYSEVADDYAAILSIIRRHPMNQFEIKSFAESRGNKDVKEIFEKLNGDSNVEQVTYKNYHSYRLK